MWIAYVVTSEDRISDGTFQKFLESITNQSEPVRIVLGLRGCSLPLELSSHIWKSVNLPLKISLSKARNELLSAYRPNDLDWVCFPDDDCWYPEGLLPRVKTMSSKMDFMLGVIDTGQKTFPEIPSPQLPLKIDLQVALRHTASAALFVAGKMMQDFTFDERLGLGAKVGSAEDLDLALNLIVRGCQGSYSTDIRVLHPYKPQRVNEYFEGSVAVLSKYFGKIPHARFSATRRIINGFVMSFGGRLPFAQAWRSLSFVTKEW